MTQPTLFSSLHRYTEPLCDDDRRRLFKQWLSINAEYVAMMVGWAEDIAESGEFGGRGRHPAEATHPGMRVNLRKSRFDATDDERDLTHQELIDGFADWLKGIDIDRQIFGGEK